MTTNLTEDEWKQRLTPEQYYLLRENGTEIPGTGALLFNDEIGVYKCVACGNEVFKSDSKYDSETPGLIGWPSFSEAANDKAVILSEDNSLGMHRTEVTCAVCGGHLGHLFPADDSPNGQHFCINSGALDFEKKG